MAKTILALSGATASLNTDGAVAYFPLGMSIRPPSLTDPADFHYHRVTRSGRLTNLRGFAQLMSRSAASIAVYLNGAVTALTATWTAVGWVVDSTHFVDVVEGDLVCLQVSAGPGSGTLLMRQAGVDFEADDGSITQWLGGRTETVLGSPNSLNSGLRYHPLMGQIPRIGSTSPVAIETLMPQPGRMSAMAVHVHQNSLNEDLLLEWVGSTVPGEVSPILTIPAGTTGRFYVNGEYQFAFGDKISIRQHTLSLAPTGTIGISNLGTEVRWSQNFILGAWNQNAQPSAETTYPYIAGTLGAGTAFSTESNRHFLITDPATLYGLHEYFKDGNGTATQTVRKNAVDQAVSIAPGAAVDTWVSTTGHAVAFASGDLLALKNVAGATVSNDVTQVIFEFVAAGVVVEEVNTSPGALRITGSTPTVLVEELVFTTPGSLIVTGGLPTISATEIVDVPGGDLILEGQQVALSVGSSVVPGRGVLVLEGGVPAIFTDFAAIVPQLATLALAVPPPPPVSASQQAVLAAGYVIPPVAVSQQAVLILVDGSPCVTERCQLWRIVRRDGVEFRYTSLDRDVFYGGQRFKSCGSLNPSASEDASSLGTVSNIELEGIISDEGITEADLYGGLFDDAYVTVDLVAWGVAPESPRRLASGWTGELSQGDTGFKMEVLGAGARLDQQALVQMVTPGCRWDFGDARCGVDLEALKVSGTVDGSVSRSIFTATLSGGAGGLQWENGTVRFTSGPNEGQRLEVRSVDFAVGVIDLWPSAAYRAEPGDSFDLYPGCDKARDGGCTVYANVINHGGFPDVPGSDSILETPDAQY